MLRNVRILVVFAKS